MERALLKITKGIAEVTLNRPNKRNALDLLMFKELTAIGEQLLETPEARVVILRGEGSAFCAGLDFMSMMSLKDGVDQLLFRDGQSPANCAQRVAWIWHELPMPVIAVLHGAVFGGGLQIALGADMRFSTADAQLSVMETKWGLCPDMTLSQTLPKLVGLDVAKWLTYTGDIVDGTRAHQLGLVTQLSDDPLQMAREVAQQIADRSPHAIRACKTLLNEGPASSVEEAFELEEKLQRQLIGSANQLEAVQANFMKRPPKFTNP
jgi:enoyl-CoA hydratase/carnithine racemase